MMRAWVSTIVALSLILGGCGKDESRGGAPDAASAGPAAIQASEAPGTSAESAGSLGRGPLREPTQRSAESGRPERDGLATIGIAQLPKQAVATLRLIEAGGPFPYPKDGVVFGNRERVLPRHPRGYYHEYTVPTPRSRDRGARRIVCGGSKRQTGDCYYTDDHYASFKRIAD
ncbi:ribonuclease [Caballeronia sp. GAFFF2]|uniref:ribonuclease n=1 Tax=Caballeronia sp. GAFFF2 TaxID=2921741 RepID=UPI0020290E76